MYEFSFNKKLTLSSSSPSAASVLVSLSILYSCVRVLILWFMQQLHKHKRDVISITVLLLCDILELRLIAENTLIIICYHLYHFIISYYQCLMRVFKVHTIPYVHIVSSPAFLQPTRSECKKQTLNLMYLAGPCEQGIATRSNLNSSLSH